MTVPPIAPCGGTAKRRWTFRVLAISIGLIPFVAAELCLRVAGLGGPADASDPFVGFSSIRPLFELNETGDRYEIPPSRKPFFKTDGFAAKKKPEEFRIFCLGGSTVQGNPYSIETSFTTWLELNLQAADPNRDWQVVNCGGISYASYRLAPILHECLQYQPDLFILYLGDNEFLEDRSYRHVQYSAWLTQLHAWMSLSRLYNVVWTWCRSGKEDESTQGETKRPAQLAAEVDALLDYQGGLEQYHRDDAWRRGVVDHFRFTLTHMLFEAKASGVPVLLVDPVCNLKDCPPFKVEPSVSLSTSDRARYDQDLSAARDGKVSAQESLERLRELIALDDRHADAWFLLGKKLIETGQYQEARQAFLRAKDEDVCPLRIIEPVREVIYEVGRETGTTIVPVMHTFEDASEYDVPGEELLLDHVHPSITGHQMIAHLLLRTMKDRGMVRFQADWFTQAQQLQKLHFQKLDTPYFARGQEHLDGLRKWTEGRVTNTRSNRGSEK